MCEKLEELRQENIRPELVMEQWEKSSEKLALFARHNEIKEVSHSITELCHSEERELLQFRVAEMYLRAIEHGEKITISNIF